MSRERVLLLESIHPVAKEILEDAGFNVTLEKKSLSEDELIKVIGDYAFLGIRSKTNVTEKVMIAAKNLHAIGAFCIGTDQIDLLAAKRMCIPVFNAPLSNTRSVAELIIGQIIMLSRRVMDKNKMMHSGKWEKTADSCFEIRGKTLGIIGYGNIGTQLGIIGEALGLKVQYFDIAKKLSIGNTKSVSSLEELLVSSDFVSIHVPDTEKTRGMISEREIMTMKRGSYLLNASRGLVVDLNALSLSLKSGHIAGAAVDVFPIEPSKNSDSFSSVLQNLQNVILTPHIGGSTEEAQDAIAREVSRSFIDMYKLIDV